MGVYGNFVDFSAGLVSSFRHPVGIQIAIKASVGSAEVLKAGSSQTSANITVYKRIVKYGVSGKKKADNLSQIE